MRRSLSTVDSEPTTRAYRDRHGNVSQMDTARIGRGTVEPDPEPQPSNVIQLGKRLNMVTWLKRIERVSRSTSGQGA